MSPPKAKAPKAKALKTKAPKSKAFPAIDGPVAQKLAAAKESTTRHWLMKTEPDVFSIDDLQKHKETTWEGVRNYQARNFMMQDMQLGDLVLIYHSNAEPSGVVGLAVVSELAQPDMTAFDKASEYYDAKTSKDKPRWYCVKVAFREKFARTISLAELQKNKSLTSMLVVQPGQRLSVQPCTKAEFEIILGLV